VIRYFGFEYPPVGIIGVLEKLDLAHHKIFIVDPIGTQSLPYHELDADSWVIITTNEGSSHQWFDRLIPRLQSHEVPLDHIIIRSCCLWDPESPVKHIHTIVDESSDFITRFRDYQLQLIKPQHHFVCLNNGHRWQRFELVSELLQRNLQQYGCISYVQAPPVPAWGFPILLDRDQLTWTEQRDIGFPELNQALFNVICETAYEVNPGGKTPTHHHRPGMTEKTYKCFILYQIPIWLAPYRAVDCYRNLGFDVFDDVVDHGYDLEPDPIKRVNLVADQIEKICSISQQDLWDLKLRYQDRFEHNWKKLCYYAHNFDSELAQWRCCF